MATVILSRAELSQVDLPLVCVRCGVAAPGLHQYRQRRDIRLPFCPAHAGTWQARRRFVWTCLLPALLFWAVGFSLIFLPDAAHQRLQLITGWATPMVYGLATILCDVGMLLFLGVLGGLLFLDWAPVRLRIASDGVATLGGVAAEFVEALRVHRQDSRQIEALPVHGQAGRHEVEQELSRLLAEHGLSLCIDWPRCEALLRRGCPGHQAGVDEAVAGLKDGLVLTLLSSTEGPPWVSHYVPLVERLESQFGWSRYVACWWVDLWMTLVRKHHPVQAQRSSSTSSMPSEHMGQAPALPENPDAATAARVECTLAPWSQ